MIDGSENEIDIIIIIIVNEYKIYNKINLML